MTTPPLVSALAWRTLPWPFERAVGALERRRGFWWLDSAQVDARLGRFSFAGCEPTATWALSAGSARLPEARRCVPGAQPQEQDAPSPVGALARLRALLPPRPEGAPELAEWPFVGGLVGAFGYELGARLEGLPAAQGGGEEAPELLFHRVDALVAHDHRRGRSLAVALGVGTDRATARAAAHAELARLEATLRAAGVDGALPARSICEASGRAAVDARPGLDAAAYAKAVDRIREHIAAGDLYQACLTHRIEAPFRGDPHALYRELRRTSPAPFAAYLQHEGLAVLSSSPERFLRVEADGRVESRPIKGTRPRGATPAEDAAHRAALSDSAKDRAENLMIVDLVRNDLGRVCATGSVEVPELFAIESYAQVHQMVSTVRGQLAPGRDALDAVAAAFPPGSMTGAPKRAAMELLARLEPVRRGLYAGALGYLDSRGGADLAVVIRTAFVRAGRLALHTGGGIVADSEPVAEWAEACAKARGILEAAARVQQITGSPA